MTHLDVAQTFWTLEHHQLPDSKPTKTQNRGPLTGPINQSKHLELLWHTDLLVIWGNAGINLPKSILIKYLLCVLCVYMTYLQIASL